MSHVMKMSARLKSLGDLQVAARALGLVCEPAQSFKYYADQDSPCMAKIRLKDQRADEYEIGIVREPDGTYSLNYDPWTYGGHFARMTEKVGENLKGLLQQTTVAAVRRSLGPNFRVQQNVNPDGSIDIDVEER